jgi:hypothetical protein
MFNIALSGTSVYVDLRGAAVRRRADLSECSYLLYRIYGLWELVNAILNLAIGLAQ